MLKSVFIFKGGLLCSRMNESFQGWAFIFKDERVFSRVGFYIQG